MAEEKNGNPLSEEFLDLSLSEVLNYHFVKSAFEAAGKEVPSRRLVSGFSNAIDDEVKHYDPETGKKFPEPKVGEKTQYSSPSKWSVAQLLKHRDPRVDYIQFIGDSGKAFFSELLSIFGIQGTSSGKVLSERSSRLLSALREQQKDE